MLDLIKPKCIQFFVLMAKYHGTMAAPTSHTHTYTKINGVKIMIMACKSLYDAIHMVYAHINSLPCNDDRLELFSPNFSSLIASSLLN